MLVSKLGAWGVGFRGWVQVWTVVTRKDSSIIGQAKVGVGVSSWFKLVVDSSIDSPFHRVVEGWCIGIIGYFYFYAW